MKPKHLEKHWIAYVRESVLNSSFWFNWLTELPVNCVKLSFSEEQTKGVHGVNCF